MTVKELKEFLDTFDDDLDVVIAHDEWGQVGSTEAAIERDSRRVGCGRSIDGEPPVVEIR